MEDNVNVVIQRRGVVSILSILGLELLSDNLFVVSTLEESISQSFFFIVKISLYILLWVLLIVSVIRNWPYIYIKQNSSEKNEGHWKKLTDVLKTLIKNSVSGNGLDLLFVVFFLLHLTWIPDAIFENVKGDYNILHPFIYLTGVLLAIMVKPQLKVVDVDKPLVMLTGISKIGVTNLSTLLMPITKNEYIEKVIVFVAKDFLVEAQLLENWDHPGATNNALIIKEKELLLSYGIDREDLVLISDFSNCTKKDDTIQIFLYNIINKIHKKIWNKKVPDIKIELVSCNYADLVELNFKVSQKVKDLLTYSEEGKNRYYSDRNLLFNLTPGTKYISIALAINSIKGDRQYCYIGQNDRNLQMKKLDVFDFRDIIEEIID